MKVLVTGGAGFIGSHLADVLLARGDSVVALDDVSTGSIDNVRHLLDHPKFQLTEGTVLHHPLVAQLAGRADVVVHLAAAVGVRLIVKQPLRSLITNIRGTEIVLESAALADARVLVASTSEVHGKNAMGPLSETSDRILGSPFVARWSYSEAKAVDAVVRLLDHPESPGDPFNIGALNETTMNGLAESILARTGSRSSVVHIPYEVAYEEGFEDMERRVPDTAKIHDLTGWEPKRSLDDILDDVITFERARLTAGA